MWTGEGKASSQLVFRDQEANLELVLSNTPIELYRRRNLFPPRV